MKLKEYIKKWKGKKNLVLITHYVVISEMLNISTTSGEIVIILIRTIISNYITNVLCDR